MLKPAGYAGRAERRVVHKGITREKDDVDAIMYAVNCGVKIIASIHASGIDDFANKENAKRLIQEQVFKRYVVLSNREGPGTLEGIYNEKLSRSQLVY